MEICFHGSGGPDKVNPIALITAKTVWSFGHSDCNSVNNIETRDKFKSDIGLSVQFICCSLTLKTVLIWYF